MSEKIIGKGSKAFTDRVDFNVPRHFYDIKHLLKNIELKPKGCRDNKIIAEISYTPELYMGSFVRGPKTRIKGPAQKIEEEIPIITCIYDNCCEKISLKTGRIELEFSKGPECYLTTNTRGKGRFSETQVTMTIKGEITALLKEVPED